MTSEQFLFCCHNRSANFFFWACAVQILFIVIFFRKGRGGGGLRLGVYVFHHNNNFNLINIYSAKTMTIEYKKKYGSIYGVNKTIIWFQIHLLFIFNCPIISCVQGIYYFVVSA